MARAKLAVDSQTTWVAGCAALLALAGAPRASAQTCTTDADCADGDACDLAPSAPDCPPGQAGCGPAQPPSGECEPKKMTCEVDADCVPGLSCEHRSQDDSCASPPQTTLDGGVPPAADPCPSPEPSPGECVYAIVECTRDSDCDDGLECAPIGDTKEQCSAPSCMPGEDCAAQQETCVEVTHTYCFPRRVDCTGNADCRDGERCVELPDDAMQHPPPGWEGATALCFPEALALALEGRVKISGGESTSEDSASSAEGPGVEPPQAGQAKAEDNSAKDDAAGSAKHDAGGCAVSAPSAHDAGGAVQWLFGGALLIASRRRPAATR